MRFEEPLGHTRVIEGLWRAARQGRLAHALCFTGAGGIGKFLAAEWLSLGLLCATGPGRPCGTCGPCRRALAGSHADLLSIDTVARGEETLPVQWIAPRKDGTETSVHEFLSLRALEGGWRIVLVRDADRANAPAQNALLKLLEEPGVRTLFVLETARPEALLPTVHSRCLRLCFDALPIEDTQRILERGGMSAAEAERLARWSRGAPGHAFKLHAQGAVEMRGVIERLLTGELDPGSAALELSDVDGDFEGKKAAVVGRLRARAFLDLLLSVLRDLHLAGAGVRTEGLAHADVCTCVAIDDRACERALEEVLSARADVDKNLQPEGPIDRALLAVYAAREAASHATRR